ncbi:hypothetical protein [Methylobacterium gnaphalii]|uniref:hypothetical protein n=3 Tax=Methylobacterium gnaphalii TaxID=1010610 RepID=UPI0024E0C92C|nr:hypothetical protein [Methylobacterium gnaphalii]
MKQLVGRLAGQVIDVPFSAAEAAQINGTAVRATDDEVLAAGHALNPEIVPADRMTLPAGYSLEPTEVGGFDLFDAARLRLNQEPHPNIADAISAAHDHLAASVLVPVGDVGFVQLPTSTTQIPTITLDDYRFDELDEGGFLVYDPAGVPIQEEAFENEDVAYDAAREHFAASRGKTLEELDADEAAAGAGDLAAVPEDWRSLHHTQRRALAQKIKGKPVANTAEADEVIEEYVTRPR